MDLTGTLWVPLSGGLRVCIDQEDWPKVSPFKWHLQEEDSEIGLCYARNRQQGLMHNFLMGGLGYDHKDGDGLNNRKSNLRRASSVENGRNRRKTPGLSSRFKGVSWRNDTSCWVVKIKVNGQRLGLGNFDDEVEAARAYDSAARKFFGEYARPNFE